MAESFLKWVLTLFLRHASLSEAAEAIRQKTGCPVVIVDKKGAVKGHSLNAEEPVQRCEQNTAILSDWPVRNHAAERGDAAGQADVAEERHRLRWIELEHKQAMQVSVQAAGTRYGSLLCFPDATGERTEEAQFNGKPESLLDDLSTALALWFEKEQIILDTQLRLQGDFVWSLAKEENQSWDEVLSRAKSLGYQVSLPYVCILGYPENLEEICRGQRPELASFEQVKQLVIEQIEGQVFEAGESIRRKTMETFQHDHLMIFLEVPIHQVNDTVYFFLDHLERRLAEQLPELVLSWGIGEYHAGIKNFHHSYEDARIALNIGRRQKGPGQRSTFTSTGIYRVLMNLSGNEDMKQITWSTIGPLIDYDHQKGADLHRTLVAYIRNQGNVSQTARVLNLHRQSLLYRMRKVESLTGRSLVDPDDLFILDLSLKLWMMGMVE